MQRASGKGKTKDERDEERNQGNRRRRGKDDVGGEGGMEDPCLLRSLGSPDRFIYRPYILNPWHERIRLWRKGENDR